MTVQQAVCPTCGAVVERYECHRETTTMETAMGFGSWLIAHFVELLPCGCTFHAAGFSAYYTGSVLTGVTGQPCGPG